MKFFYLSSVANSEGSHEVHHRDCELIPDSLNRDYLGPFNNGLEAIRKAEKMNPKVSLCEVCCKIISQPVFFKEKNG